MDVYKKCFQHLTSEEEWCARMCESMIAYGNFLGGYSDKTYLTKYRNALGSERVNWIFNTLCNYIHESCDILVGVHTDSDGVSYNSIVEKGRNL